MNNDRKHNFIRSNSFNLRLNYDKKANNKNKQIIEQQLKKKTKTSDSMFIEKEVKIPEKKENFRHIKGILFGKRERWQVVKSISEYKELEFLPRKKRVVSINAANWDHFFDKTEIEVKRPCVKACQQKMLENSMSSRTIYPEYDTSMSKLFKKKVDFPSRLKSTATGSLSNLLECTSMETPKLIKNRRQDLNSLIFKPEFASIIPYKRNKSFVDLKAIKRDSSFAGINSEYRREDVFTRLPHKNFSSHKKYLDLTSNVFPNDNSFSNSFYTEDKKQRLVLNNYKTAFIKNKPDLNESRILKTPPLTDRKREESNMIYSVDVTDNTRKKVMGSGMKKINNMNPLSNYSTKVHSMALSKKNSQESQGTKNPQIIAY